MKALGQLFTRRPGTRLRTGAACMAGIAAAAALAACGSTPAPPGGQAAGAAHASSAAPSSRASAGVTACATSELRVTLDASAAGVAAGSSYVPLEFTNASSSTCTLAGYPAVAFASGVAGPQIGTAAAAEVSTHPASLVLAPGGIAHAWLQIVDVANLPSSQCKPVQASGLRVSFSGTQTAAFLAHPFPACANALHGSEVLAVFPVQAGAAKRGTAP
ncbi:MAG TPA: DUF4232 domain-containing protein [Streptosporangiaceae bacterium]|nr:DUF4232 domain-containing protein [Streptosporangiaceae bacterium]